jgi:hypothetical protein
VQPPLEDLTKGAADMVNLPPPVVQDNKAKQHPERNHQNDEKIDGGNRLGVIAQERPPGLRRRTPGPRHIFRHCCLGDIDPEFEQLTVNAGRSP